MIPARRASPPVSLGKLLEHARVAIVILLIKDADGVDNCVRLPGHGHDLGEVVFAGVVAAIADHDQHFLVAIALLQVLESGGNRIVQRGLRQSAAILDRATSNWPTWSVKGCCPEDRTKPFR